MTSLRQLLSSLSLPGTPLDSIHDCAVAGVTCDSRRVVPGSIFVALRGAMVDGHAYVRQAVAGGCCAVVVEEEVNPGVGTPVVRVDDSHLAYGLLAAAFHNHPARELTLIGLTGTNGKTTTSWIIEEMLRAAGKQVGVIGTVNYRYGNAQGRKVVRDAPLTTPEPMELQRLLREMRDGGVTHVVMEVSSHALVQQRLAGLQFAVAVFTNLSRDHLDFHGDMESYFAAKQILFTRLLQPDGVAVVVAGESSGTDSGADWGKRLLGLLRQQGFGEQESRRGGRRILACGMAADSFVRAANCVQGLHGFTAELFLGTQGYPLRSHLIGGHNVLNTLAAAGVGMALGLEPSRFIAGLEEVSLVPGRLEPVSLPGATAEDRLPRVFVDYAHTPDALEHVLRTLRPLTPGRLFCVVGCGGDRDRGKRSLMGRAAAELADGLLITSDNPRSEDPAAIIAAVEEGARQAGGRRVTLAELFSPGQRPKRYCIEADRKRAIHAGCALAGEGDVVLVAGKGHETYQIIGGGRHFFDDRLEAGNGMLHWTPERLQRATGGTLTAAGEISLLGGISTDTRTIRAGDVFLALQGEQFDGHDYAKTAAEKGAACLVLSRPCPEIEGVSVILVGDTLRAYQDLAQWRRRLLGPQLKVVAVTGSSGKTTVKEMAAAIFNLQYGGTPTESVLKTQGNLNNLVGLPRTLLQVDAGHRVAVLEMGMNRPGEILRLAETADPDLGCITNVQAAHLEGLGTIGGVARAKGELFAAMRPDAIRVVNCDDARVRAMAKRFGGRSIGFAATPAGRRFRPEVRASRIVSLGEAGMRFTLHIGEYSLRLTVPATGAHNVGNCAAAAAIATAAGVAPEVIAEGLAAYRSGDKRQQIVPLAGGISVLNDCYNANPGSMAAALRTVSTFGGNCRRVAALGDMLELGRDAAAAHRRVGELVAEIGLDYLAVTGEHAAVVASAAAAGGMDKARIRVCADTAAVAAWLAQLIGQQKITAGDWILLKGSRGMRMERVLAALAELTVANGT